MKLPSSSGKYRTLCVRTCDGYYFPIGNAVSRSRFMRDAAQCRASCGEEARLFYLPSGSDNVSTSLDLAGRSYVRMPAAFKYRKSLTDGCTCRPMPWSTAELQRHQGYAEEAARATAEAEAKRLAAEAADAARIAAADKPSRNDKSKAAKTAERTANIAIARGKIDRETDPVTGVMADEPLTTAGPVAASNDDAGTRVANAAPGKFAARAEQVRSSASGRGGERGTVARRQNAVARAPVQQGSGTSWFTPSSSKYTWPGDAPRR